MILRGDKAMRALVYEGERNLNFRDVPEPQPRAGEVLLRPLYVGLCFSEMHCYARDDWAVFPKGLVFGHEGSGQVVEVGDGVSGWKAGDRVAVNPFYTCGKCVMCQAGFRLRCLDPKDWFPAMCTDVFTAPEQCLFRLPDNVSDADAALVEPMTVGTRAVRLSGMAVGDNVVVLGVDDYGMSAMQWVRRGGAGKIVAVDPVAVRRRVALTLGADIALDPATDGIVAEDVHDPSQVRRRHAAHPYPRIQDEMPFGPDMVFVSIEMYLPESLHYIADAIRMVRFGGTIVIVRAYYGEGGEGAMPNFLAMAAWNKEVTIKHFGIFYGEEPWRGGRDRGDYALTIQELARGGIKGRASVTEVVPWQDLKTKADVEAVYDMYPHRAAKILFKFPGSN